MIDLAAERVRAALSEGGRPDLARRVGTNRAGEATFPRLALAADLSDEDLRIIHQAMTVVHGADWDRGVDWFVDWCRQQTKPAWGRGGHFCPLHDDWFADLHDDCWEATKSGN